jgi:hypothetical protein
MLIVGLEKISFLRALREEVKWFSLPQLGEQFMKMKSCILVCMTVAVVFGCSVASVRADDLYQPPWERGDTNTTYQSWTFGTIDNPAAPDTVFNLYGAPTATINGGTWASFYDNHVGVWTLGSTNSIDLYIPNTPADPTRTKDVWTQITWQSSLGGSPVVTVNGIVSTLEFSVLAGNGSWMQSVFMATLPFNPAAEDVVVTGTMAVGEVVIDTQCIPEPSSLALLAMGAISLLSYASRKRRLAA